MCEVWQEYVKHERSYVNVCLSDGEAILGYMYACDPETGSIGLLSPGPTVHLIFSADLKSVSAAGKIPEDVPTTLPAHEEARSVALGCQAVLDGLKRRRIDAKIMEDGTGNYISVFDGIATVQPPFVPESCRSTSENILLSVKQVLAEIYDAHKDAGAGD